MFFKKRNIIAFLISICVFMVSIFIIFLFWKFLPKGYRINESSDYFGFYEPVAKNILLGKGIVDRYGKLAVHYPCGYPILLAGVFKLSKILNFPEQKIIYLFILFCIGISSVFIFLLAKILWGNFGGIISFLLWIFYPPLLWLTKQPNSEIPFLVFLYGGFLLFFYGIFYKKMNWFIYFFSGILIGCSMLIRPIAIGLGLLLAIILWLYFKEIKISKRLFLLILIIFGNLLIISPWELFVYSKIKKFIPLSISGVNAIFDGLTFGVNLKGYRKNINFSEDVKIMMQDIKEKKDTLNTLNDIMLFMTKKIQSQPLTVFKLFLIKSIRSWYSTDSNRFEKPILFMQMVYLIIILWASYLTYKKGYIFKKVVIFIWAIVIYFWIITTFALSILRYMVPIVGVTFIFLPAIFFKKIKKI